MRVRKRIWERFELCQGYSGLFRDNWVRLALVYGIVWPKKGEEMTNFRITKSEGNPNDQAEKGSGQRRGLTESVLLYGFVRDITGYYGII